MTTDDRQDGDTGIWQEDWGAQADERTQRHAAPEVDAPEVTLQARSLPARLAAGGRFEKPLASTIAHQPTGVLRSIATSADAKPLLTVQSPTPSRALARATAQEEAPVDEPSNEPVADEPASAPVPLAPRPPSGGSRGGLFAGATDFVLRLIRRPTDPDPDIEPEPEPAPHPSAPPPTAAQPTTPAPVARTPEAPSRVPDTASEPATDATPAPATNATPTPPGASQATIEPPTPLLASNEEVPEEPLQSSTTALHADTTPLVLRSTAVEAPAQIARHAEETVEPPAPVAEPPLPAQDLQAVAPVEDAIEAPMAQVTTEAPAEETRVEPTIEPLSSPGPLPAVSSIAREESPEEAVLEKPALAQTEMEPAAQASLDSYDDEPAREPTAPSSESGGLGGLFLTLRRLVSRESHDETDEPAPAEAPAASIESPASAPTAPIARSVETPQETPELMPATGTPVLASEAIETPTTSVIERPVSESTDSQPLDLHAETAVDDTAAAAYETSPEAQAGAYTRFALLRARSAGEPLGDDADEEPGALEADSVQEEEPAAIEEPAAAQAAFSDAPSEPLALRSSARAVEQPAQTTEAITTTPVTIARSVTDKPPVEASRPSEARWTEYAAPPIQRSVSEPATRESGTPPMHLQVARTAVTRAIEREAAASSSPEAAPALASVSSAPIQRPADAPPTLERASPEYAAPRSDFGVAGSAFATAADLAFFSTPSSSANTSAGPIARSLSPLVYRQVQRTPEGSQSAPASVSAFDMAQYDFASDPVEAANAVLRRASEGSSATQTFSAPASIIQRLAAEGGGEAPAAAAMSAPGGAAPTASDAEAAAPGAAGAVEDPSKAPNLVLDKLAREIYERLRRRLLMERERAGYGTAYS